MTIKLHRFPSSYGVSSCYLPECSYIIRKKEKRVIYSPIKENQKQNDNTSITRQLYRIDLVEKKCKQAIVHHQIALQLGGPADDLSGVAPIFSVHCYSFLLLL